MPKTKISKTSKTLKKSQKEDNSMLLEKELSIANQQTRRRASTFEFSSPIPKCRIFGNTPSTQQDSAFKTLSKYYTGEKERSQSEIQDLIYFDQVHEKLREFHLGDFLAFHNLQEKFRAKMVDWMIEVFGIYKQKPRTIFKAIQIMDSYYSAKRQVVPLEELHLNGIVCILIASKVEEVSYIKLRAAVETIGRNKFSVSQVASREMEILSTINFSTNFPTIYDLLRCSFRFIKFDSEEAEEFFQKSVFLIAKMCIFSYELLTKMTIREIALCSIVIGFKLAKKIKGFGVDSSVG